MSDHRSVFDTLPLLILIHMDFHTFAPSYSALALAETGMVATQAVERKQSKYLRLAFKSYFTPVAIETSDFSTSEDFTRELAHRLEQVIGDSNFLHYLL